MLIYSGIITLDYTPATDVLVTSMPDVKQFSLSEVRFSLELIVENIRNYDIKNLLLDSSNSIIEVEDSAYKSVTSKFATDLMATRLQKIARVVTSDAKREERSARLATELKQEMNMPVEFKNFTTRKDAMHWLLDA
ncbi:hypothetical protein [Pontibacter akesuensis]|uniref:SpoIIAA-like n=1 Tax=Pontibacter akesuensis TaxID=388950 RepID=A0A1I7I6R7_9BACT|nr:hypothetical protein [Pontibacter akesuensis]GHA65499.1 hypothetical protein GCM10007389_17960 [Pontibacter akesuensis]SFU68643.1 hypothetical protein SAMN04487941_1964 [Pontibacter akesuensis]